MHTFFINTSDKNVDEGKILFDINYENRALVALKCRIEDWPDKEKGYLACVEKMSEMMDMYDDMNKRFNLIIYILTFRQCGKKHSNKTRWPMTTEGIWKR